MDMQIRPDSSALGRKDSGRFTFWWPPFLFDLFSLRRYHDKQYGYG